METGHTEPSGTFKLQLDRRAHSRQERIVPFQKDSKSFESAKGQMHSGQPSTACSGTGTGMLVPPPPFPPPAPQLPPPPVLLKPGLGGFRKVCRTEEAGPCPFPGLATGVLEMRVKEGSKIRNLMGFAMARMQEEGTVGGGRGDGGTARQIVFTGSGRAVTKTITCAEIMKRKVQGLHQVTKLHYKGVQEVWESQESGGGASEMTVHRTVPSISILLSKDPLDPQEPGYQPPATISVSAFWDAPSQEEKEGEDLLQTAGKRSYSPSAHPIQPDSKRPCLTD
ncbi:hypothetical protein JZ751_018238, partial [Albula glossodonta]